MLLLFCCCCCFSSSFLLVVVVVVVVCLLLLLLLLLFFVVFCTNCFCINVANIYNLVLTECFYQTIFCYSVIRNLFDINRDEIRISTRVKGNK